MLEDELLSYLKGRFDFNVQTLHELEEARKLIGGNQISKLDPSENLCEKITEKIIELRKQLREEISQYITHYYESKLFGENFVCKLD